MTWRVSYLSWARPSAPSVKRHLDLELMEDQADHLASSFLIPPRYDLAWLGDVYFELGRNVRPEEHAWRFLRPLFPNTAERFGWSNYAQMRASARADLERAGDPPESLFRRMLRAMVLRLQPREGPVDGPFMDGYLEVKEELDDLCELCLRRGPDGAREVLARQVQKPDSPTLPAGLAGDRYELRPPRVDLAGRLAQSVHLIPADSNPHADDEGLWVDRHHPGSGIATLEGWLRLVDDDVALRIYRHESWQRSAQRT